MLNVLVAGTGSIGRRHVSSIRTLEPDSRLILLRASGAEDDYSREIGATVVADFGAAARLAPDCIVVATPSFLHTDLVVEALAAGLPAYVEKPVVTNAADLERVAAALARRSPADGPLATMCGCNLRFLPSLRAVRDRVRGGAIGRVVRASFQVGQWLPDWRPHADYRLSYSALAARGGGVVLDLVHELDAARWILGDFDRLVALGGHRSHLEIDAEDVAVIALSRDAGPVVAVGLDYIARVPIRRYEFIGEEGTLCWELPARRIELQSTLGAQPVNLDATAYDVSATYLTAMREFLEAVRTHQITSQDLGDGLRSAALAIRANEVIRSCRS